MKQEQEKKSTIMLVCLTLLVILPTKGVVLVMLGRENHTSMVLISYWFTAWAMRRHLGVQALLTTLILILLLSFSVCVFLWWKKQQWQLFVEKKASQLIEILNSFCGCLWYCTIVTHLFNPPPCLSQKILSPLPKHDENNPIVQGNCGPHLCNFTCKSNLPFFLCFCFILRLPTTFWLWGNEEV